MMSLHSRHKFLVLVALRRATNAIKYIFHIYFIFII